MSLFPYRIKPFIINLVYIYVTKRNFSFGCFVSHLRIEYKRNVDTTTNKERKITKRKMKKKCRINSTDDDDKIRFKSQDSL